MYHFLLWWGDNTGRWFPLSHLALVLLFHFLIEYHEKALAMHHWNRNASLCCECAITWSCLIVSGDTIDLTADVHLFTRPMTAIARRNVHLHQHSWTCLCPGDFSPTHIYLFFCREACRETTEQSLCQAKVTISEKIWILDVLFDLLEDLFYGVSICARVRCTKFLPLKLLNYVKKKKNI